MEENTPNATSTAFYFGEQPIWTPEIGRKAEIVANWVSNDLPGGLIYGLQHTGKTQFAKYLVEVLPSMIGPQFTGVLWSFAGFKAKTVDEMLKRCLTHSGCSVLTTRSQAVLLKRLGDTLIRRCQARQASRLLIVADEIQNVAHPLFDVFMSIETDLSERGIRSCQVSVGQPEMQRSVELFTQNDMHQVIGRFFPRCEIYWALTVADVREMLENLDGPERTFSHKHFPQRAQAGFAVADLCTPLELALNDVMADQSLTGCPRLPLRYLRPVLNMLFRYLAQGPDAIADKNVVLECFALAGMTNVLRHYVDRPDGG